MDVVGAYISWIDICFIANNKFMQWVGFIANDKLCSVCFVLTSIICIVDVI